MKYAYHLKWIIALLVTITANQLSAYEHPNLDGQLFFVAGSPGNKTPQRYPTVLYTIDNDLRLTRLRPITTQEQGASFISVYNEDDLVLVGNESQKGFLQLDYINMNNVTKEKSYEIKLCNGCSYTKGHHLQKENKYYFIARSIKTVDGKPKINLDGLDYESGQNVTLDNSAFRYIKTNGASKGNYNGIFVDSLYSYANKPVFSSLFKIDLGWSFPSSYEPADGDRFAQLINNNEIIVFLPLKKIEHDKSIDKKTLYYVFSKQHQRWSSINLSSASWLRSFGQWISTEEQTQGFNQDEELQHYIKAKMSQPNGYVPYKHVLERFKYWDIRKTGLLHLINPVKNIHIEIKTGKPDSEIILVENNLVVYRVEDQIFTADITGNKITNTQLLLKHDMVPAIHWAFMGKM